MLFEGLPDFQSQEQASPFPVSSYTVDIDFRHLEEHLQRYVEHYGLDLNPDFQRAHVWTETQQAAFILYRLRRGPHARTLYFACPGWHDSTTPGPMVIVDGKQRLEAVRRFMRDELPVLGAIRRQWTGRIRWHASFQINVADIDRAQTLHWYLALNESGTPHTDAELARVRKLIQR